MSSQSNFEVGFAEHEITAWVGKALMKQMLRAIQFVYERRETNLVFYPKVSVEQSVVDETTAKPQDSSHLIYVVRRYGPVGGMERYVWELTLHLRQLGYQVTVICERCHVDKPQGIRVVELGEVTPRPRWLAALRFDNRVSEWLASNPQPNSIVHSHERISSQDISTFHGSIFAAVLDKPWWRLISFRIAMQLFLERRELTKSRLIVPNSQRIKQQLTHYYPELAYKLTEPIKPGVTAGTFRENRNVPSDGGVIGFVGTEWKRKGLPLAVEIVKQLSIFRPHLKFVVLGAPASKVKHLFADCQFEYVLMGENVQVNYSEFDVLLHPATTEPYGMVISEAMSAKVPVVVSCACGACEDITPKSGSILPLISSIEAWVEALEHQLCRTQQVPQFVRSWNEVVQEYEEAYRVLYIKCTFELNRSPAAALPFYSGN